MAKLSSAALVRAYEKVVSYHCCLRFIKTAITHLLRITGIHCWLDLSEALADKQSSVNEHAVGGAIDFEIAEQDIRAEQRQDLIDAIV